MDDCYDGSISRKGEPAAYIKYGMPQAILSGAFSLIDYSEQAVKMCPEGGAMAYAVNMKGYLRSNLIEIEWRDRLYCPDEQEYMTLEIEKWFTIVNILLELIQLKSGDKRNFTDMTRSVAIFYAIVNDYSDFVDSSIAEGKIRCDDMTEGKFTHPMIHAIKVKGNREVYGKSIRSLQKCC
jgi:geranylgeranyl pyrophosphate synthase